MCTVLVLDVFGWTTFDVLAESQTLAPVDTNRGDYTLASMMTMYQYHVFPLKHVRLCLFRLHNLQLC